MSRTSQLRWAAEADSVEFPGSDIDPRLQSVVESPFVRKSGALLLEILANGSLRPEAFPDLTGFEALVNKIHVEDYVNADVAPSSAIGELVRQGVASAMRLAQRLESEGSYRVLMSLDVEGEALTLRFFERRPGVSFGGDDPDSFELEEVIMIDTATYDV